MTGPSNLPPGVSVMDENINPGDPPLEAILEHAAEIARHEFEGSFSLEYLESDKGWGWYARVPTGDDWGFHEHNPAEAILEALDIAGELEVP